MKNDHDNTNNNPYRGAALAFALVGQVGLLISLGALLGIGAGLFIDRELHTSPIATLIGLLLGLAAGIYGVFRLIASVRKTE
ncbi:MAG TPA: AtpZ/AtpI family protein [Ktedonobacterales bacterium]|nr:AtpZ/AtpI family protein [Ktedonobacterales bacterium]